MHTTLARLAENISKRPLNLREATAALLPPIPYAAISVDAFHNLMFFSLYRRILRAHRYLPVEMRSLGDDYVKAGAPACRVVTSRIFLTRLSEFRRHRDVTNPGHVIGFLSQWKVYLDQIPIGPEAQHFRGKKLDPTIFEKVRVGQTPVSVPVTKALFFQLSEEQLGQMYELMNATKDLWKLDVDRDRDTR